MESPKDIFSCTPSKPSTFISKIRNKFGAQNDPFGFDQKTGGSLTDPLRLGSPIKANIPHSAHKLELLSPLKPEAMDSKDVKLEAGIGTKRAELAWEGAEPVRGPMVLGVEEGRAAEHLIAEEAENSATDHQSRVYPEYEERSVKMEPYPELYQAVPAAPPAPELLEANPFNFDDPLTGQLQPNSH